MMTLAIVSGERGEEEAHTPLAPPSHAFDRLLGFAPLLGPDVLGLEKDLHRQTFASHACGVGVHHPHTLLGLRLWRDCEESPHTTLYELEKILRMLLRQSVLAADIFLSLDRTSSSSLDTSWLLSCAVTADLGQALLQRATGPMGFISASIQRDTPIATSLLLPALLDVMTCSALSHHTLYTRHFPTLLELDEHAMLRDVCSQLLDPSKVTHSPRIAAPLCELFELLSEERPFLNSLPPRPLGYDALHEFLVEQRMEAANQP